MITLRGNKIILPISMLDCDLLSVWYVQPLKKSRVWRWSSERNLFQFRSTHLFPISCAFLFVSLRAPLVQFVITSAFSIAPFFSTLALDLTRNNEMCRESVFFYSCLFAPLLAAARARLLNYRHLEHFRREAKAAHGSDDGGRGQR